LSLPAYVIVVQHKPYIQVQETHSGPQGKESHEEVSPFVLCRIYVFGGQLQNEICRHVLRTVREGKNVDTKVKDQTCTVRLSIQGHQFCVSIS
jgi:hypothetical protein